MAKEVICGIYEIINLVNNKRYIGLSINIYERWRQHISDLNNASHNNAHLQSAWNKYKQESFRFNIIEQCDKENLPDREMYWIAYYDSYNNGYNDSLGGEGPTGYVMTDEQKQKLSRVKIDFFASEENRLKQSIASNHRCKPIYQIDLDGNIVNEWRSIKWAASKLGILQSGISAAVNHRKHTKVYNGYVWIPKDQYNPDTFDIKKYLASDRVCHTIYQYTKGGDLLCQYDKVSDVKKNGFNPVCVGSGCKQHTPYKGYYWSYVKHDTPEDLFSDGYGRFNRVYKKIYQYTLDGQFVKEWKNIHDVVDVGGFNKCSIYDCCSGKTNYSQGYYWTYSSLIDASIFPIQEKINPRSLSKTVYQYTLDYQLVKEWPSLYSIYTSTEYTQHHLRQCVNNLIPNYGGYIFSYKNPTEIGGVNYAC